MYSDDRKKIIETGEKHGKETEKGNMNSGQREEKQNMEKKKKQKEQKK